MAIIEAASASAYGIMAGSNVDHDAAYAIAAAERGDACNVTMFGLSEWGRWACLEAGIRNGHLAVVQKVLGVVAFPPPESSGVLLELRRGIVAGHGRVAQVVLQTAWPKNVRALICPVHSAALSGLLFAAATAGDLEFCAWASNQYPDLREHITENGISAEMLKAAATSGSPKICEWAWSLVRDAEFSVADRTDLLKTFARTARGRLFSWLTNRRGFKLSGRWDEIHTDVLAAAAETGQTDACAALMSCNPTREALENAYMLAASRGHVATCLLLEGAFVPSQKVALRAIGDAAANAKFATCLIVARHLAKDKDTQRKAGMKVIRSLWDGVQFTESRHTSLCDIAQWAIQTFDLSKSDVQRASKDEYDSAVGRALEEVIANWWR